MHNLRVKPPPPVQKPDSHLTVTAHMPGLLLGRCKLLAEAIAKH